ncbi:MAG: hypothetical protein ACFFD4_40310, partial [Candidatus Odinarchaeota archaeon]
NEMNPRTGSVLNECVKHYLEHEKVVAFSNSDSTLNALTITCKNANLDVMTLVGDYNPLKGGKEGFKELNKKKTRERLEAFYHGSAMILFLPVKKRVYFEQANVDTVIFHDINVKRKGKEVLTVMEAMKESTGARRKIILFCVKGGPDEPVAHKIRRDVNLSSDSPGKGEQQYQLVDRINDEIKRIRNRNKKKERMKSKPVTDFKDQSNQFRVTLPILWNYNQLIAYLNRSNCIVNHERTKFLICQIGKQQLVVTVVRMDSFMETGFQKKFKEEIRQNKERMVGKAEMNCWLIIERPEEHGKGTKLENIDRFYELLSNFRNDTGSGFQLLVTNGEQESELLIIKLLKSTILSNTCF